MRRKNLSRNKISSAEGGGALSCEAGEGRGGVFLTGAEKTPPRPSPALARGRGRRHPPGPDGRSYSVTSPGLWTVLFFLALPARLISAAESDRAIEVLRYGCANELGHREVTLFLNGTVRLLDGPPGEELMGLEELSPEELDGAMNRLKAEDLSEAQRHMPASLTGPYIEHCELDLLLPDRKPQVFRFTHYDALPLGLSRVLQVAKDMEAKVEDLRGKEVLPPDYVARVHDVLKRYDGMRYKIVRFTPDDKAVELQGLDQPLYLFVLREEMHKEFVALVSRRQ